MRWWQAQLGQVARLRLSGAAIALPVGLQLTIELVLPFSSVNMSNESVEIFLFCLINHLKY